MPGRLVFVVEETCIVNLYHNILLVFGLIIFWHLRRMSLISVDLIVEYWSVLDLILDSTWVCNLLLELKIHWFDIEMLYCVVDTVKFIGSSSSSMDHTFDLMMCNLSFLGRLSLSLWGRHCFETTLVYIMDWLLQWSKDFSDTTVFGWPTLTMSNRTFYSRLRFEAVRCYLYVEKLIWRRNVVFWLVLYSEGCTDTLFEPLRSWEVSQLVTNELVIHVWMRTSLIWELLEVFSMFLNSSSEIEFCRLVAAGIVSTDLYLKNLRFVNWKPGIEFTSWDIGSKDWCQKFI